MSNIISAYDVLIIYPNTDYTYNAQLFMDEALSVKPDTTGFIVEGKIKMSNGDIIDMNLSINDTGYVTGVIPNSTTYTVIDGTYCIDITDITPSTTRYESGIVKIMEGCA